MQPLQHQLRFKLSQRYQGVMDKDHAMMLNRIDLTVKEEILDLSNTTKIFKTSTAKVWIGQNHIIKIRILHN